MSHAKNRAEALRWLLTAEEDIRAAEVLAAGAMFAQACFYAQQSAEKAVKSLWYAIDADPWGHSVQRLLSEFPAKAGDDDWEPWITRGALLDKLYIPTRYPNGLPDLTPGQVYGRDDADRALEAAAFLVAHCRDWMTGRDQ